MFKILIFIWHCHGNASKEGEIMSFFLFFYHFRNFTWLFQHRTTRGARTNTKLFINQEYMCSDVALLIKKFDVGPCVMWYWNLKLKLLKKQKNVKNYAKWHFHLICQCIHGNSEHTNNVEYSLGHYMFNILPLSCECKMHELRNFNFSENLRSK